MHSGYSCDFNIMGISIYQVPEGPPIEIAFTKISI